EVGKRRLRNGHRDLDLARLHHQERLRQILLDDVARIEDVIPFIGRRRGKRAEVDRSFFGAHRPCLRGSGANLPTLPLTSFHPATRAWFERVLGSPTKAQVQAWPAILRGESTLVCSPTGSGKTLAAFLASIDRLAFGPPPALPGVRVLYISP